MYMWGVCEKEKEERKGVKRGFGGYSGHSHISACLCYRYTEAIMQGPSNKTALINFNQSDLRSN